MNRGRLWQLIRKEFRQTLRDPRAARMIFISPVLQVLIFGFVVMLAALWAADVIFTDRSGDGARVTASAAPVGER